MSGIRILHNPRCSKSRQALEWLRSRGIEPEIIFYLETPLDAKQLNELLDQLDTTPQELLRNSESEFKSTGQDSRSMTQEQIVAMLASHPRLLQRPIVIIGKHARIARPVERIAELL